MRYDPPPRRAFVGVPIGGRMAEQLGRLQRTLFGRARAEGRKVASIPRRALSIPLVDLGDHHLETLEAVQVAVDRTLRETPELELSLGVVSVWPTPDDPQLINVAVNDPTGALSTLRKTLAGDLAAYGFEVNSGTFTPHIPLTRITGEGPPVNIDDVSSDGQLQVKALTAFVQQVRHSRLRMRPLWTRPFAQDPLLRESSDADDLVAEIRAQLDERLSKRAVSFRSRKVRKRAADLTPDIDLDDATDDPVADAAEDLS